MKPQLSCKSTQPINSHIILWKQFNTNVLVRTSKQIFQRMRKLQTFLHCVGQSRRMTFSVVIGSLGICCWIALYLSQTSSTMNPARHQQLPSFEGNTEATQVCSLGCDWWEVIVGLDNGLASKRWQASIYGNDDSVQRHTYTLLEGQQLMEFQQSCT